jgi:HK97 family phage major capsid protein
MPTSLQLREQRASVWNEMQSLMERADGEGRALTVDELATYDTAEARLSDLDGQVERQEKYENRSREMATVDRSELRHDGGAAIEPADADKQYSHAFSNYLKRGMARLSPQDSAALERGFIPAAGDGQPQNALSVGTNTAGGYLVPTGWRNDFIRTMKAYGNVQNEAQVLETASGQALPWPTVNDTTNVGRLLAENTQMSETDVVFGTATLGAYVYSSDLTRLSLQLINDAAFDVDGLVQSLHAERIGRIVNQHFTTGTGTSQPQGIVTGATSGVTAAGVAAITSDEVISLVHSVDPAYRQSPRAKFMMSDAALALLRKVKDTTGQYIWQPGMQAGIASSLYGYPVVINQDMAVPATGVKSVLFGDFYAGYVVRIVQGIQTITFAERYLDFLQVGHSSYMRCDGKVQNTAAYKALTQA